MSIPQAVSEETQLCLNPEYSCLTRQHLSNQFRNCFKMSFRRHASDTPTSTEEIAEQDKVKKTCLFIINKLAEIYSVNIWFSIERVSYNLPGATPDETCEIYTNFEDGENTIKAKENVEGFLYLIQGARHEFQANNLENEPNLINFDKLMRKFHELANGGWIPPYAENSEEL